MWYRIVVVFLAFANPAFGADWSYTGSSGPENWGSVSENCNGKNQSPINIVTADAEYDDDLPIVDRNYFYNPPNSMAVLNNGHTIQVNLGNGYTITDKKLLPFDAKAAQYHFHWGTADASSYTNGSEHTMDGMRYFGELHVVHYNTKYADLNAAADKSDGLAVFGWFISVTYPQINQDIKNLLDLAGSLAPNQNSGSPEAASPTFSVETLIPPNIDEYYRYQGSLTTPNCYESVVWTVFKNPIEITQAQAQQLASSFYEGTTGTTAIVNNYRPVQKLNDRKVTKPRPLVQSSGSRASSPIITGLLALVISTASLH